LYTVERKRLCNFYVNLRGADSSLRSWQSFS